MASRHFTHLGMRSSQAFRRRTRASRFGMVLLLVLVVVAMLSLGSYAFTDLMITHREAADLAGRQLQTRLIVDSGIDATRQFLSVTPEELQSAGGVYDNPDTFKGINVVQDEDPALRGSFAVVAPAINDEGDFEGVRHGLEDESARLNLNTLLIADDMQPGAGRTLLMALPGMTEDIADAILDWMDPDTEARDLGAEDDHYSGLNPPYAAKNGPLETVEELLLVRGVTPQLLFGSDANRNGTLDPVEGASGDVDTANLRGWASLLTLHSQEMNQNPKGEPRIYLNEPDLNKLQQSLTAVMPSEWVTFILAYRRYGPYSGSERGQQGIVETIDTSQPGRAVLSQVLDLVGARVQLPANGNSTSTVIASPFEDSIASMNVTLPVLLDHCTINPSEKIPGRININQAPACILRGIPGMNDDMVSRILSARIPESTEEKPGRRHETWLAAEGILTLTEMRQMAPYMTCRGSVFRGQIVGYFEGGTTASRAEVIFDSTSKPTQVLFWRDISHLGRGYAVQTLGVGFTE